MKFLKKKSEMDVIIKLIIGESLNILFFIM